MNYRQVFAIQQKRERQIKAICPTINKSAGIYIFYRIDEDGIKHAYVGQAKNLLRRAAQHLGEYDRIALSLKKRGFYSVANPNGWRLSFKNCGEAELDENERVSIKHYADKGYQLYNATSGGQGKGKNGFDKNRPTKGYHDGVAYGYLKARREISHLFKLHLDVKTKKENPTKLQLKALEKFNEFVEVENVEHTE